MIAPRRTGLVALAAVLLIAACEEKNAQPVKDAAPAPSATAAPMASDASVSARPRSDASVAMPARPVPKSSPTVTQTMPEKVQMQAIQYMMAMETPQPDDANADPEWAKQIAEQLSPIAKTFDRGDRSKDRVEVVASGRKIDVFLGHGCEAEVPTRMTARAGVSLASLLVHGVLVVRCVDDHGQCLQSTRDPEDVLCTIVPRRAR